MKTEKKLEMENKVEQRERQNSNKISIHLSVPDRHILLRIMNLLFVKPTETKKPLLPAANSINSLMKVICVHNSNASYYIHTHIIPTSVI